MSFPIIKYLLHPYSIIGQDTFPRLFLSQSWWVVSVTDIPQKRGLILNRLTIMDQKTTGSFSKESVDD